MRNISCGINLPLKQRVNQFFLSPVDGDPLGQFAIIQQDEGEWGLIVKERLDRETKDRYRLRVIATDGKSEAPVTVDVHVLDINDNSPLCDQVSRPAAAPQTRPQWEKLKCPLGQGIQFYLLCTFS